MRLTTPAFRNVIGYNMGTFFKRKWAAFRHQKVVDNGEAEVLKELNIPVYTMEEIVQEKKKRIAFEMPEPVEPVPLRMDFTHPDWHDRIAHCYGENTDILEGIQQILQLTKSIQVKHGLPDEIENSIGKIMLEDQNKLVQRSMLYALSFESTQDKLPRIPNDRFYKYPIVYGIPKERQNMQLMRNLFRLCDGVGAESNGKSILRKCYLEKRNIRANIEKDGDLVQFQIEPHFIVTTSSPVKSFAPREVINNTPLLDVPDIFPLKSIANFAKENIYKTTNEFCVPNASRYNNAHMAVFLYNPIVNKLDEETFGARLIAHTFSVALASAIDKFGEEQQTLENPLCIHSLHTDGQKFRFATFQLNTLNFNGTEGIKNMLWMTPQLQLFDVCGYHKGKPVIEGFNPQVFDILLAVHCSH